MWSELTWFMWSDFVLKWSEVKWSDVKCSDVEWTDVIYAKWFCFEVKWSEANWNEVSCGEVLEDKSTIYVRITLYWGYLIVLWLFRLVFILYCGCFNLFCIVLVCVCVGVLTLVWVFGKCVLVFTVFRIVSNVFFVLFRLCIFILMGPVAHSVLQLTTDWTVQDRIAVGTRFSARPDRPWGPPSLL